jgi:predicted small lipoprotein YifL
MKKTIYALIILLLLCSVTGCVNSGDVNSGNLPESEAAATPETPPFAEENTIDIFLTGEEFHKAMLSVDEPKNKVVGRISGYYIPDKVPENAVQINFNIQNEGTPRVSLDFAFTDSVFS